MRLLVDTSILIDHLRGRPAAVGLLTEAVLNGNELWSLSVVRLEVLIGMRPPESAATHALLGQLRWLDVDADLADRAAEIGRPYLRSHPGVDTVDYLLAAAVEALDARLVTTNVRHFPMIQGLTAAY